MIDPAAPPEILASRPTPTAPIIANYAPGQIRDLFLASLDEGDPARAIEIARHLVQSGNPLPSVVCIALALPPGSSYGAAAIAVLARGTGQT